MNKDDLVIGVLIEESTTISFIEVCQKYAIPEELLIEMIEEGLFPDHPADPKKITLNQKALQRIESAFRLHRDLGINLPGVALALELVDEMVSLRQELEILRKHL